MATPKITKPTYTAVGDVNSIFVMFQCYIHKHDTDNITTRCFFVKVSYKGVEWGNGIQAFCFIDFGWIWCES